jgi:hypothetical protein
VFRVHVIMGRSRNGSPCSEYVYFVDVLSKLVPSQPLSTNERATDFEISVRDYMSPRRSGGRAKEIKQREAPKCPQLRSVRGHRQKRIGVSRPRMIVGRRRRLCCGYR